MTSRCVNITRSCSYLAGHLDLLALSSPLLQVGPDLLHHPGVQENLLHPVVLGCQARREVQRNLRPHTSIDFIVDVQNYNASENFFLMTKHTNVVTILFVKL